MTPPPTLQELIETVRQDAGSDQPIDQLVVAAAAAAQLEETTDALLGHFVDRCRRDGRSWTEISNALGVTKQAVHKRFAPGARGAHLRGDPSARPSSGSPTGPATSSLPPGRPRCRSAPTPSGPSTCCSALFAEPAGIAGRALAAMNVTEDGVRAALQARSSDRDGHTPRSGRQRRGRASRHRPQ